MYGWLSGGVKKRQGQFGLGFFFFFFFFAKKNVHLYQCPVAECLLGYARNAGIDPTMDGHATDGCWTGGISVFFMVPPVFGVKEFDGSVILGLKCTLI